MIQRWMTFDREWHKSEHGDWVQWDDVLALHDRLVKERDDLDKRRVAEIEDLQRKLSEAFDSEVRTEGERQRLQALASAMRKVLPDHLLQEVLAHLDPLTPFVEFLKRNERG